MVTRNELAYDILETLRAHLTDDEDIDIRQIESFVKDYRADFLKQRFDKNPFMIDASSIQILEDIDVTKVDSSCVSGYTTGEYLMRTNITIPDTVRRKGKIGSLLHISSADKLGGSFTITNYGTAIESGHGRFNRDEIFAFPYDGYIYFFSRGDAFKLIYNVNIQGVFTDPAAAYAISADTTVYTGNENYYTPRDLKRYIVNSILKDKYKIMVNQPVDNIDDGMHELEK